MMPVILTFTRDSHKFKLEAHQGYSEIIISQTPKNKIASKTFKSIGFVSNLLIHKTAVNLNH